MPFQKYDMLPWRTHRAQPVVRWMGWLAVKDSMALLLDPEIYLDCISVTGNSHENRFDFYMSVHLHDF